MKRIEAIVRPSKANDVYAAIMKIGHSGIMLSEVEGHGAEKGAETNARGLTYNFDLVTKARIELIVQDEEAEGIVAAILKAAFTGKVGDGKIFIHPVADAVRVRTSERGEDAIH